MLARLLELIFPIRDDEKMVRELANDELLALLDPELVPLGSGDSAAALLPFTDKRVRATVHEAKYRGTERAFALLCAVLSEYLREAMSESFVAGSYVLVPVPLGAARRAERGFNQAEEVAKRAAKELGIPLDATILTRTRETTSQVSLPRAKRLQNMRGAFTLSLSRGSAFDPAHTYIILDDVLTTGATLSAAVAALKSAGASNVLAVALAH
jgi:ComF family protein